VSEAADAGERRPGAVLSAVPHPAPSALVARKKGPIKVYGAYSSPDVRACVASLSHTPTLRSATKKSEDPTSSFGPAKMADAIDEGVDPRTSDKSAFEALKRAILDGHGVEVQS